MFATLFWITFFANPCTSSFPKWFWNNTNDEKMKKYTVQMAQTKMFFDNFISIISFCYFLTSFRFGLTVQKQNKISIFKEITFLSLPPPTSKWICCSITTYFLNNKRNSSSLKCNVVLVNDSEIVLIFKNYKKFKKFRITALVFYFDK